MDIANLIERFFGLFQTNNFLSGGFILMLIGAIGAYLRFLPSKLWGHVKGHLFISLEINSQDQLFRWVESWIATHTYTKISRRLIAFTASRRYDHMIEEEEYEIGSQKKNKIPEVYCGPAPGWHFFFYKNRLFVLQRDREKLGGNTGMVSLYETFYIKIFTRNKQIVNEFLEMIRDNEANKYEEKVKIFIPDEDYWYSVGSIDSRPLDSVILDVGIKEKILKDIQEFINKKTWYHNMGIPYRRGYLFYGDPGCGKTSLVTALAKEFNMNLHILSLSSKSTTDGKLNKLFTDTNNAIVLIEDIDCIFNQREKVGESEVTFSGLLNAIDGAYSGKGRILIMTTNHIEKLDSALIRPGRIDLKIKFNKASKYQIKEFYKRFYETDDEAAAEVFLNRIGEKETTPAELQNLLLEEQWHKINT